ncbi:Pumilio-like 3 [Apiospora phragmitis]|uniref:Pumilio-like 3 n=1 Tax=Apiospora phragmitis TaxID=2905665 RepID=A0ABR1TRB0_9PEZI
MAPRDVATGSKRKSPTGSKDQTNKKPKFEKRPAPKEEPVVDENDDDFETFSDDAEDGGASLDNKKANGSNGAEASNGTNSREAHQKQKQIALERRNQKPLADESLRAKKLWERLRRKSHVPKEERDKLVDELFTIVTGRIKEFALKHDTVRVVQTAIKYSNPERRKMIANELKGTFAQLAESKYAKFLIGKLIVEGEKEIRELIVPEFYGKIRKLINHPEASWIVDDIYRGVATSEQKAVMLREWYGPEFAVFRSSGDAASTSELAKIIEEQPSKRPIIMRYLLDLTNQLIQKKMTGFTMLHDAMLQYFLNTKTGTEEAKEYIEMIKEDESDLLKNMAFTKSGARLVSLLLAYGSAKDRKQILKAYKDTFQMMSTDAHGYLIILTAYDVIDDTVLTSKSIFPEMLGRGEQDDGNNLVVLANDPHGRLCVRYLFEGPSRALFDGRHRRVALERLAEIDEIRKTTSKKDPEIRRKELITAIFPPMISSVESSALELVSTPFGCQMVEDILLSAVGDKSKALEAVASAAGGDPDAENEVDDEEEAKAEDDEEPAQVHISKNSFASRLFKTLIAGGRYDKVTKQIKPVDPPLHFADIFYPVVKDYIVSWATGPSSFVVLNLLQAEDFSHGDEVRKILKKEMKALEKAASEETPEQKAAREAAETSGDGDKTATKGKKGPKKERPVGNTGARLLLEMLKK